MRPRLPAATIALALIVGGTSCTGRGDGADPTARPSGSLTPSPSSSPSSLPSDSPTPAPTPEPSPQPAAPSTLVYSRPGTVVALDLDDGTKRTIASVPSQDIYVSSSGDMVAYVEGAGPDDDFAGQPVLKVLHPASGRTEVVGPGFLPQWGAVKGQEALVYTQPVGDRRCVAEACPGQRKVRLYLPGSGRDVDLLGSGHWNVLAWGGGIVLVADQGDLSHTVTVSLDGRRGSLPLPPYEVWDISPDGGWLVRSLRRGAEFIPLEDGVPAGSPVPIPLDGAVLAEGDWAPEDAEIAAVLLRLSGGGTATELGTLSPEHPQPRIVTGSRRAGGPVLHAPLGDAFAYTRAEASGRLTAVVCEGPRGPCEEVLSWGRGILLNALY